MRTWLVLLPLVAAAGACNRGATTGSDGDGTAATRCAGQAAHIRALYRQAPAPEGDEDTSPELAQELLEANVEMVLNDCQKDPDRTVPCIERAGSAATLEKSCVVPLDDEGLVEQREFGGR